jgi:hypothetical protein
VAVVEICAYEPLCEFKREDEDGNEKELPLEIDGKEVGGFEDGYLIGVELGPENDDSSYEYTVGELYDLKQWIKSEHFDLDDIALATLKKALRETV